VFIDARREGGESGGQKAESGENLRRQEAGGR
jgi:hypothetical protein